MSAINETAEVIMTMVEAGFTKGGWGLGGPAGASFRDPEGFLSFKGGPG